MNESPMIRHQKLTILQQIDELKNWHKQQQLKLNSSSSSLESVHLANENNTKQTFSNNHKNSAVNPETNKNQDNKSPSQNFDDTPVKGVQPNLHALIENNFPVSGNQHLQPNHNEKPKFKFLKKGEGIARFRMGPVKVKKNKSGNKLNLQPAKDSNPTGKLLTGNIENAQKPTEGDKTPFLQPPDLKLDFKNWKSIFSSGNAIELIENAVDNNQLDIFQPNSSIDSSTASIMEKILVIGRKHLKEREEMRVFETIEQHVMDTSFCSTSSYVTKLMENAVMSTPEKKLECEKSNNKSKEFSQDVLNNRPVENVKLKDVDENRKMDKAQVWTKACDIEHSSNKPKKDKEDLDLEQSLHVRFNEVVDYNSFIECSHSLTDSKDNKNNNIEQFEDGNEWNDYSSEDSSICCSQCSSNNIPLGADVGLDNAPTSIHNEDTNTEINKYNPVEKLDVKDLTTDNCQSLGMKLSSIEEPNVISPLLNAKLKELENEIEAFRSENNKLTAVREKLEKERRLFETEKKKFLIEIEEERKKNATYLDEEKKKLAKEKFIFEKYSKNLTKKPLKEERKEIQALKEQLDEMKEELNKKESRWGAAQARVRNQVKLLEEDNKKLREELEVLRRQSKSLQILTQKKSKTSVNNTKLIHAISEHISSLGPVSDDKKAKDCGYFNTNMNGIKTVSVEDVDTKSINTVKVIKEHSQKTSEPILNEAQNKENHLQDKDKITEETENTNANLPLPPVSYGQKVNSFNHRLSGKIDLEESEVTSKMPVDDTSVSSVREITNEDGHVEKIYPDGRKEIRLKNGNIKKIDPLSGYVKTIYYNGDVKELTSNGTIKYYFSESRIWHTTFPDGLEVLDFPNGQVEKRHTNGTVEIIYPNNCKKITYSDGLEEIFYADGTKIKIDGNKKKVLSLPNGQKEIHTEECIRREYPDGTVKIVYPDGTTETVYSNGRVRLKDKHGNLVMDSGITPPIT